MGNKKLSVIIPAFNEESTIESILQKVLAADLPGDMAREIIVVDDGSKDQTAEIVQAFIHRNPNHPVRLLLQPKNMGKGAAIKRGVAEVQGNFVVVQDADLEYDPREYADLLKPVMEGYADVVYGSRFQGNNPHRILFFWHTIGNKFLTFVSNIFTNLNLTDIESCYKLFRREIIQELDLREKGFGFEPEVTAKICRIPGIRIYEIGISYYGRTYDAGKKVSAADGFRALYCILKYNIFSR